MEIDAARRLNRREICLIYGVPPWLVNREDDTWRVRLWWHTRWLRRTWLRNARRYDWRRRWGR